MDMKPNIELHIEELVLHGFRHSDRHRIGEALQFELTRLISEQGIPAGFYGDYHIAAHDGGCFRIAAETTANKIVSDLAGKVYEAMANSITSLRD